MSIKSFTDLQQSKKLAEILPLESADMHIIVEDVVDEYYGDIVTLSKTNIGTPSKYDIPCWSLVALLNVLPQGYSLGNKKSNGKYYICMTCIKHDVIEYNEPVDACYELILKLHELNIL